MLLIFFSQNYQIYCWKKLDKNFGFEESVKLKKDREQNTFFKYGPTINTPESLQAKITKKLEVSLKTDMQELGYL